MYHNPTPLSYTTSPHHPLALISHQNNNHTYKNAFIMAVVWGSNLSWRLKQTKPRIIHLIQRLPEYTPICLICIYIAHCGVIPRTRGSNFGYQWRARIKDKATQMGGFVFVMCKPKDLNPKPRGFEPQQKGRIMPVCASRFCKVATQSFWARQF